MTQFYSNPSRESDTYALPDCETFQLTAIEVAATMEDEIYEFSRRHEFRLASMNSRTREAMLEAMVAELNITGGWFYWYCFPGCMPEGLPIGPYASQRDAIDAAQEDCRAMMRACVGFALVAGTAATSTLWLISTLARLCA